MKHSSKEIIINDSNTNLHKLKVRKRFCKTKLSTRTTISDRKQSTMFITPNNISTYTQQTINNTHNYNRNHHKSATPSKTLTSFFLSKSSSQNSIKAISTSPESLYNNFPLSFPPLRKTLNSYHRTKSELICSGYKKITNIHHETLKHKFNSTYKKLFLTTTPQSPTHHKVHSIESFSNINQTNSIIYNNNNNNSPSSLDAKCIKKTPKMLGNKFKIYPTLSRNEFTQKVINTFKCGIICTNLKNEFDSKVSEIKHQIKDIDNKINMINNDKEIIHKYHEQFNAYVKYLHYRTCEEMEVLRKLNEKKYDLEYEVKNLNEKITQNETIVSNMESFKQLIHNCLGCELNKELTCETFFDKINYLENKILINIEKFQIKRKDILELKNEKQQLQNIILNQQTKTNHQITLLNKQLFDLQQRYLLLFQNKQILNEDHKCNSTFIRKKHSTINTINNKDPNIDAMHFELKFENLNNENPKLYTCIAEMLSGIIKSIIQFNKHFLSIQTDDNHFICTEDTLITIINMKYNKRNILKVRNHIMTMIKIVERSYERIVNSIKHIQSNSKEADANVKELIENIHDEKKSRFIIEQKKLIEKLQNDKMQKVMNKLNGLTYVNKRRIFHELDYKHNTNKRSKHITYNNTIKTIEELNNEERLNMLQY